MPMKVTMKREGPTPEEALDELRAQVADGLLADMRTAPSPGGPYNRTGHLVAGLTIRHTPTGAEIEAPADRLTEENTRRGFLALCEKQWRALGINHATGGRR